MQIELASYILFSFLHSFNPSYIAVGALNWSNDYQINSDSFRNRTNFSTLEIFKYRIGKFPQLSPFALEVNLHKRTLDHLEKMKYKRVT